MKQREIKVLLQEIEARIAAGECIDMRGLLETLPESDKIKQQFAKRAKWTWLDSGFDTYQLLIDILRIEFEKGEKVSVFHVIHAIKSILDEGKLPKHWKSERGRNSIKEVIHNLYNQRYISQELKSKWLDNIPILPKNNYIRIHLTKSTSLKTFLKRAERAFRGRIRS